MSIRIVPFLKNENYHIYNRGSNKMNIFIDNKDYDRFLKLLYVLNSKESKKFSDIETSPGLAWTYEKGESLVDIIFYCLMPNHFHLVIKEISENGITIFLHRLSTAYSMYFNKKYNHSGAVFQGKFKSEHIDNDNYFKYLFSYVHLNPIKLIQNDWRNVGIKKIDEAKNYLSNYKYSSFLDISEKSKRIEEKIINKLSIPDYFISTDGFKNEVFTWLNYKNNEK